MRLEQCQHRQQGLEACLERASAERPRSGERPQELTLSVVTRQRDSRDDRLPKLQAGSLWQEQALLFGQVTR